MANSGFSRSTSCTPEGLRFQPERLTNSSLACTYSPIAASLPAESTEHPAAKPSSWTTARAALLVAAIVRSNSTVHDDSYELLQLHCITVGRKRNSSTVILLSHLGETNRICT